MIYVMQFMTWKTLSNMSSSSWARANGSKLLLGLLCLSLIALTGWNVSLQRSLHGTRSNVDASGRHHISKREIPVEHLEDPVVDWTSDEADPPRRRPAARMGGAVYIHWGLSSCPAEDTELIYEGIVGGSSHDGHGGGSNYLCLPREPQWNKYTDALEGTGKIYGAEFETVGNFFDSEHGRSYQDHDPVCAVCLSTVRRSQVMIPARRECPKHWTMEYEGYLMAGHYGHPATYHFICVDKSPVRDPEGYRNDNGALLYHIQGVCGSLPCPNYIQGRELTCVVCTK